MLQVRADCLYARPGIDRLRDQTGTLTAAPFVAAGGRWSVEADLADLAALAVDLRR